MKYVSDLRIDKFIRKNIFEPLNLSESGFYGEKLSNVIEVWNPDNTSATIEKLGPEECAGNIIQSAYDLNRFATEYKTLKFDSKRW